MRFIRQIHTTSQRLRDAYILSAARTPIGNFNGALASVPAVELGALVAKAAVERASIPASAVEEVLFGQVLQGDAGQAPARQVGIKAGLPDSAEATTINKVCASGLKTVTLAAQAIKAGDRNIILAGGTESMSQSPFYLKRGLAFGDGKIVDSIVGDALTDPYDKIHMGLCCENTNKRDNITREEQDEYAIESYKRAQRAQDAGEFDAEIVPVEVKTRKGTVEVKDDEAVKAVKLDKIPALKPAFDRKNGTVTAANASSINDGAAALIVASGESAKELKAPVLARIVAYADAATAPIDFTIAPSLAIPALLEKAGLKADDIAKWEINEAFAGVSITNNRRLNIDPAKVNVKGGAVALGHPVGASGARILTTLLYELKDGEYGVAAICNGGGAATSILVQKVSEVN